MGKLEVGGVKINITPPLGCKMRGYASRETGAAGIHDDLYSRIFYLKSGEKEAVIVSLDLCLINRDNMNLLMQRIKDRTGLEKEQIIINTTHTHAGPDLKGNPIAENYKEELFNKIAGGMGWAQRKAEPATYSHGRENVVIGVNRREKKSGGR